MNGLSYIFASLGFQEDCIAYQSKQITELLVLAFGRMSLLALANLYLPEESETVTQQNAKMKWSFCVHSDTVGTSTEKNVLQIKSSLSSEKIQ